LIDFKGGSLKRSLWMASPAFTTPKTFGLEAYLSDGPIHKKAVCKSR